MPTISSFNANNFFLRYKFTQKYPGDMSKGSMIEASAVLGESIGFMPGTVFQNYTQNSYIVWDAARRELAARALAEPDGVLPDILCLQEVENMAALRVFNGRYLHNHYPYLLLIDAYDPRNIDVGVMSRFPITQIRTHIDDQENNIRIFSRDCLEVDFLLPDGKTLTVFVNHLKSKFSGNEIDEEWRLTNMLEGHKKRLRQAQVVAELVEKRFTGSFDTALFAVVGDFNDTPFSPWVAPLVNSPHLVNVVSQFCELDNQWTFFWRSKGRVSQIDYILASPALARRIEEVCRENSQCKPHIERRGLSFQRINAQGSLLPATVKMTWFEDDEVTPTPPNLPEETRCNFRFERYPEVLMDWKNNISDHCPVKVWF